MAEGAERGRPSSVEEELRERIALLSRETADPARAERNLLRLFERAPAAPFLPRLSEICSLFAVSQFLANYSVSNPAELLSALAEMHRPLSRELLRERTESELRPDDDRDTADMIRALRLFKKRYLLRITLRDVTGETDILSSMDELTLLAEAIISVALEWSLRVNSERFGHPEGGTVAVIGLGKLGGAELNYSSDVDLIALYGPADGQTPGVVNPAGVRVNRISNHEFYCRVVELFTRMLSQSTEDGIAYRVDLRLRPQGQKGELALPLKAYQTYYESWGRTWERMVLIRARPVAGDRGLGEAFLEVIRPFVWRTALDYADMEEIRGLKKRIDSTLARDDIKRGYGGIREVEFFVHTFQLLYGGDNRSLRTHRLFNAMQVLRWLKIVPREDLATLWDNYLYLRRIEHYLQMREDLQTHVLPVAEGEREVLAREMGFSSVPAFLADLRLRRMQVKNMYNSLLGTEEDLHAEALALIEGDLADEELKGFLSFRGVKDPAAGLSNLKKVRERMGSFKTQRERALLRRVVPPFLEKALRAESPDRALSGLESLIALLDEREACLTGMAEQEGLVDAVVRLFSLSSYLARIFVSSPRHLDTLVEGMVTRKTLRQMEVELAREVRLGGDFLESLGEYKRSEELRLGFFFLSRTLPVLDLLRYLSHLADAVIGTILRRSGAPGLSVIGVGKLGGRELTFGSDLDIIFLSPSPADVKSAEEVVRTLSAHTGKGMLYEVDVRLRPDGSKGALVKDLGGFKSYYLNSAQPWELQALLRARPVAGDREAGGAFLEMSREVLRCRGREVERDEVRAMRERIVRELSQESQGMDIKLGPGGIEEIEFYVQFLQLRHGGDSPEVLVQNMPAAIHRLQCKGLLKDSDGKALCRAYEYFRKVETFLRLNGEHALRDDAPVTELAALFMEEESTGDFLARLRGLRERVLEIAS